MEPEDLSCPWCSSLGSFARWAQLLCHGGLRRAGRQWAINGSVEGWNEMLQLGRQ